MLYWALKTRVPDGAGAQKYAFEPRFSLPGFSHDAFPQFEVQRCFVAFQPPQIMVQQSAPKSGIGGLISNGIRWQPLQNNPAGNG